MKEVTKKNIMIVLLLLILCGLGFVFFTQPILVNNSTGYSLLNFCDDLVDYELLEIARGE